MGNGIERQMEREGRREGREGDAVGPGNLLRSSSDVCMLDTLALALSPRITTTTKKELSFYIIINLVLGLFCFPPCVLPRPSSLLPPPLLLLQAFFIAITAWPLCVVPKCLGIVRLLIAPRSILLHCWPRLMATH